MPVRYVLLLVLFLIPFVSPVFAQEEIIVNATEPCFLNYTASYRMLENCNANEDFLKWILMGWEWITGGYFGMIIVSLIIGAVYIKYREAIYAIYIGFIFVPISYMFFPDVFLSWAILMGFVGVGILVWYAIIRQTE